MANTSQKLIDTERRVVYKWTGNTAEPAALKIDAGALNFSLNANNQLLGSGTDRKSTYRLSLKKVIYDVAAGQPANGYVELYWAGTPNQTIATLSGQGQMDFAEGGDGIIILNNATGAGANGNVGLQTVNFAGTGCAYTIIADFRKHSEDFSTVDRN